MSSKIIQEVITTLQDIGAVGDPVNGTKEVQNKMMSFNMSDIDLANEEVEVKKYYNEALGENYAGRLKIEQDHYLFLEYALKHKISEIQYFHKGEDMSSRKYIVFSGDCINCMNILIRKDRNTFNVFMRSSDCLRLLPMDLLWCMKIFYNVLSRHGENCKALDTVNFWITSCHYYDRDKSICEEVIDGEDIFS